MSTRALGSLTAMKYEPQQQTLMEKSLTLLSVTSEESMIRTHSRKPYFEDSFEEISGGEKIIGIGRLCSPAIDVATVPPQLYGTTKRGRPYANDKILEVTANK